MEILHIFLISIKVIMNSILGSSVPIILYVITQHIEILTTKNLTHKYINLHHFKIESQCYNQSRVQIIRLTVVCTITIHVVQFYIITTTTYQLEVSTFIIKINHHDWHVVVVVGMPNSTTDYELDFISQMYCD